MAITIGNKDLIYGCFTMCIPHLLLGLILKESWSLVCNICYQFFVNLIMEVL
jgi:hypothetical protein